MTTDSMVGEGVLSLSEMVAPSVAPLASLADLVEPLYQDAVDADRARREKRPRGPVTGIRPLDRSLGGFLRPGIHGVTGDPGSGKTVLALQAAGQGNYPAIYVTAEQSRFALFPRVIARVTGHSIEEMEALPPLDYRNLAERTATEVSKMAILDATSHPVSAQRIMDAARIVRDVHEAAHVLVVIDAWQPWARKLYTTMAEYDAVQAAIGDLEHISSELHCPVLLLSHRNRAAAKGGEDSYLIAAKGSADFEHAAETVLYIARDPGTTRQPVRKVTIHVAKNRHGQDNMPVDVVLDSEHHCFLEVDDRYA